MNIMFIISVVVMAIGWIIYGIAAFSKKKSEDTMASAATITIAKDIAKMIVSDIQQVFVEPAKKENDGKLTEEQAKKAFDLAYSRLSMVAEENDIFAKALEFFKTKPAESAGETADFRLVAIDPSDPIRSLIEEAVMDVKNNKAIKDAIVDIALDTFEQGFSDYDYDDDDDDEDGELVPVKFDKYGNMYPDDDDDEDEEDDEDDDE